MKLTNTKKSEMVSGAILRHPFMSSDSHLTQMKMLARNHMKIKRIRKTSS